LALAACAAADSSLGDDDADTGTDDTPAAEEEATIKFSWWGSDTRNELTQQVLDNVMVKQPRITVVSDFTDWTGYWDKLATTVAAGDAPDVITQEERYLLDDASRGVLADILDYSEIIDLSNIDDTILGFW